jgi:Tfp pilus assembly protein PilP
MILSVIFLFGLNTAWADMTTPSAVPPAVPVSSPITDDVLKVRDPFKRPVLTTSKGKPKGDLELFAVEQFKLVGVITGPMKIRAMVEAPNGKTYFVSEKQKIGQRNGVVKKITPLAVLVRETMVNVVGREEEIDFEIRLPEDLKAQAAPGSGG